MQHVCVSQFGFSNVEMTKGVRMHRKQPGKEYIGLIAKVTFGWWSDTRFLFVCCHACLYCLNFLLQ